MLLGKLFIHSLKHFTLHVQERTAGELVGAWPVDDPNDDRNSCIKENIKAHDKRGLLWLLLLKFSVRGAGLHERHHHVVRLWGHSGILAHYLRRQCAYRRAVRGETRCVVERSNVTAWHRMNVQELRRDAMGDRRLRADREPDRARNHRDQSRAERDRSRAGVRHCERGLRQ